MDLPSSQPAPDAGTDPSSDPRANRPPMSVEAGPSRCHMETSFYNILQSSGFAEWAARAEEQNERLRSGTWAQSKECDAQPPPSADGKSSLESSSVAATAATTAGPTRGPSKRASRLRKLKETEEKPSKTRTTRSKRRDDVAEEEEEEEGEEEEEEERDGNDGSPADNFVARYSNYSSMDAELSILTKHLMQHGGC